MIATQVKMTPPEVAKLWKVSPDKVLNWIRSGQLRAINVSNGARPRWVIDQQDLNDFAERKANAPAPRVPPTKQREEYQGYKWF